VVNDIDSRSIRRELDTHRDQLTHAHEVLRQHTLDIAALREAQADDHSHLLEMRLNVGAQAEELKRIGQLTDQSYQLLLKHQGEELALFHSLSKRIVWAGSIGLLVVFGLSLLIRDLGLIEWLRTLSPFN